MVSKAGTRLVMSHTKMARRESTTNYHRQRASSIPWRPGLSSGRAHRGAIPVAMPKGEVTPTTAYEAAWPWI